MYNKLQSFKKLQLEFGKNVYIWNQHQETLHFQDPKSFLISFSS